MARVLVVDDEPNVRHLLGRVLTNAGHAADCVATGNAAVEFIQRHAVEAIVLDYRLPDMNGHQVLSAVRRICPEVGIIMITGFPTYPRAVEAIRLGAFDFLAKPFDNNDLLVALARLLERQRWHRSQEVDPIVRLRSMLRTSSAAPHPGSELLTELLGLAVSPTLTTPLFAAIARAIGQLLKVRDQSVLRNTLCGQFDDILAADGRSWPRAVVVATARLEANRTLSIESLAQDFHVSAPQLGRLIRKHTGLTVPEWKMMSALRVALPIVVHSREHSRQIAFRLGYKHPETFSRHFRRVFGFPPSYFGSLCQQPDKNSHVLADSVNQVRSRLA